MLSVIPVPVRELPDRWHRRIAERRALSAVDPAADALEAAARELDEAIAAARDLARLVSTTEYAELHGVRPSTVRKWCARGLVSGARRDASKDWRIPAGATRAARKSA